MIVAKNNANISSEENGFLIDLSVYGKSKTDSKFNQFLKNKKIKLSRSQACSGFISSLNNNG